jgi:hypothetical protein
MMGNRLIEREGGGGGGGGGGKIYELMSTMLVNLSVQE